MKHLTSLNIKQYRGFYDLNIQNFGEINIIVGDNNVGKTTLLETIMLLRDIENFSNILRVSKLRNYGTFSPFRNSTFDDFYYIFNPKDVNKLLEIEATVNNDLVKLKLSGKFETILIDIKDLPKYIIHNHFNENFINENEAKAFIGKLYTETKNNINFTQEINFNEYSRVTGIPIKNNQPHKIIYISPTEHTSGNIFSNLVSNEKLKEKVIDLLKLYDKDIEDILFLKNNETARPLECLKHKNLGIMPLSVYGDGIKRVLLLANGIAEAENGILLIDEIETAIHSKYYENVFNFLIENCQKYNVQLFITTHNMETIDEFLKILYEENTKENEDDLLRFITLRKNKESKIKARILLGNEVYKYRDNFDFEVRI